MHELQHFLISCFLFSIACNADYTTSALSQQSWDAIVLNTGAKLAPRNNNSTRTVYVPHPITFSTQHKHFHHHNPAPRYNLHHMNTEQLAWYFSTHGYTEGEVLSHPMLYMNKAYLALAKQLPRYPEYVKMYHDEYKKLNWFTKGLGRMLFIYKPKLQRQFALLWRECKKVRECKEREEHTKKQKELAAYNAKFEALANDEVMLDAVPYSHQQARDKAHTHIKTAALDRATRQYIITHDVITFAHEYNIAERDLISLQGNAYEQQMHSEFLEQLTEAHIISSYYALQPKNILIDAVSRGIAIGMEANRLQQPDTATAWANFGWKALDLLQAAGEGLLLCAENTANMLLHPKHTLQQTVHGLGMITGLVARTCARTVGTALYWHELMQHGDGLMMAQEMDQVACKVKALGTYCIEKAASLEARDVVKYGTVIAADAILTHKMFMLGGTLCTRATPIISDAIAHISTRMTTMGKTITNALEAVRAESPVLQTTEGMLMKASEGLNKAGSAATEVIKGTRLALETVHAEYMARLEIELQALRLVYDNKVKGFAEFANKWLKIEYEHILGIDLIFDRKGFPRINGFHHDLMGAIEKSGAIEFTNKTVYNAGFYKADLVIDGTKITKTFFPSEWPRKKVIEKIYEAYENCIKSGVLPELGSDGKYVIQSNIQEGIDIKMCITQKGKVLTAYPILR